MLKTVNSGFLRVQCVRTGSDCGWPTRTESDFPYLTLLEILRNILSASALDMSADGDPHWRFICVDLEFLKFG